MRFLPLALAAFPLPVLADSFTVETLPTTVTVYSGFAMVTREVNIEVPEGAHEVILPDLPPAAEADSAEVLAAKEQIEAQTLVATQTQIAAQQEFARDRARARRIAAQS